MTQYSYFGLHPSPNFLRKYSLSVGGSPFSGKEAPILVYPLDRAVLSHCITKSSCLNKRQNRAWLTLTDTIFLFWTSSRIKFCKEALFSRWLSIFRQRSKYPGVPLRSVGQDSSVSLVTRYSLDGPAIEFPRGRDILPLSRPTLGPTQPATRCVLGFSRG